MKLLRLTILVCAVLVGVALTPCTAWATQPFVTSAELPPQLLPPPPAEGSDGWKKNIRGVIAAQKHMDAEAITAMRDEQHMRLSLLTDVIGPDFTRATYPQSYALLDQVLADSEAISRADKDYWHTRRPYLTDAHVKLMIDRIDQSPSYPSGHTSGSRVLAEVLGMLYPDRLAELRAKAEEIAQHRVEAGVHYPGDIEAGRFLAMMMVGALEKSAEFKDALAEARAEIR